MAWSISDSICLEPSPEHSKSEHPGTFERPLINLEAGQN